MSKPLNRYETKSLELFNKIFKNTTPHFKKFLKDIEKFSFTERDENIELYNLWLNNFREDGDYSSISEPDRSGSKIVNLIEKMINTPDISQDEIESWFSNPIILGDKFTYGTYDRYSSINSLEAESDGLYLYLDSEDWEKYFSGLGDDNTYFYNMANNAYYGGGYEWSDGDEEFNYVLNGYPDEYRKNLHNLAKAVGDFEFAKKVINHKEEEGDFSEFLEKYFPNERSDIIDDYLSDLSSVRTEAAEKSVRECYEENVKYTSSGKADIFIPWQDLLKIYEENPGSNNLSDLFDLDINGDYIPDLGSCWYESWPSREDFISIFESLNYKIEKIIEELEAGGYGNISVAQEMWDIIHKLGFKGSTGKKYKKKTSHGVEIIILGFDVENGKFTILVKYPKTMTSKWIDGVDHEKITVDKDDLTNWVSSLPLDRQLESKLKKNIVESYDLKINNFVKNFLDKLEVIEIRPSETDEFAWFVEFYNENLEDFIHKFTNRKNEAGLLVYTFSDKNSKNYIFNNWFMSRLITDYLESKFPVFDDDNVRVLVSDYLDKRSRQVLSDSGIDVTEPHEIF